ncbi:MAG: thioesterase family protein [Chitinophagaceae bacterium]
MFTSETQIRIHYALTDQMGVVYYGNYAQFYEIGRTEAIRALGFTYKEIEAMGIVLAVTDMHIKFLRPAKYDDVITVKTTLRKFLCIIKSFSMERSYNQENELLNTGEVTLYFLEAKTMKRINMPEELKEKLAGYF